MRPSGYLLGMYEVETHTGRLEWIQNRSHASIIPKIEENVAEGSEIVTDELRTYACLADRGFRFTHRTVNHSR